MIHERLAQRCKLRRTRGATTDGLDFLARNLDLAVGGRRAAGSIHVADQAALLVEQPLGFTLLLPQAVPLGLSQVAVIRALVPSGVAPSLWPMIE